MDQDCKKYWTRPPWGDVLSGGWPWVQKRWILPVQKHEAALCPAMEIPDKAKKYEGIIIFGRREDLGVPVVAAVANTDEFTL